MADGGWVGIAIPEEYGGGGQGITEASIVLEEVAASGAAMNGCSAIHLSIFGMDPVVKHGSRGAEASRCLPRVACRRAARRVRRDRARRRHRHHVDHAPGPCSTATTTSCGAARCGPPRRRTARRCCCWCAPRRSRSAPKPTDGMTLLLVDLQTARGRRSPRSPSSAATRWCRARCVYDDLPVPVSRPRRRGGPGLPLPARRAQPRAHPDRRRGARHRPGRAATRRWTTPTSGSCSAGRSARTRASPSRWPRPTWSCTRPSWRSARRRGATTTACRAARRRTRPSTSPPRPAFFAADRAMQTHGGMGYATEYHVERYWREARLMSIAPVSQEMVLQLHRRARARPAPELLMGDLPTARTEPAVLPERTTAQRASDLDRQAVVDHLRVATSEGRITLDEFAERVGLVMEARTHEELVPVTADLPAVPGQHHRAPLRELCRRTCRNAAPSPGHHTLGGACHAGPWAAAREMTVVAVFGHSQVDLTACRLAPGVDSVDVRTIGVFAGVEWWCRRAPWSMRAVSSRVRWPPAAARGRTTTGDGVASTGPLLGLFGGLAGAGAPPGSLRRLGRSTRSVKTHVGGYLPSRGASPDSAVTADDVASVARLLGRRPEGRVRGRRPPRRTAARW